MSGFGEGPGYGFGWYERLTHGDPGQKFWAFVIGFCLTVRLAVKVFY